MSASASNASWYFSAGPLSTLRIHVRHSDTVPQAKEETPPPTSRFGTPPPGDLFIIGREAHFDGGAFQFTTTVIGDGVVLISSLTTNFVPSLLGQ